MAKIIYYAKIGSIKRHIAGFTRDEAQRALENATDGDLLEGLAGYPELRIRNFVDENAIDVFDDAPEAYAIENPETGEYVCLNNPLAAYRCDGEPESLKEALAEADAIRIGSGAILESWEADNGYLVATENDYDGNVEEHRIPLDGAKRIGAFTWGAKDGTPVDLYHFEPVRVGGAG